MKTLKLIFVGVMILFSNLIYAGGDSITWERYLLHTAKHGNIYRLNADNYVEGTRILFYPGSIRHYEYIPKPEFSQLTESEIIRHTESNKEYLITTWMLGARSMSIVIFDLSDPKKEIFYQFSSMEIYYGVDGDTIHVEYAVTDEDLQDMEAIGKEVSFTLPK